MTSGKVEKPYQVLRISEMMREAKTGGIEKFYRIQYMTKGGVVDTIDIAEKDYTEEKVSKRLTEVAAKHDKILAS